MRVAFYFVITTETDVKNKLKTEKINSNLPKTKIWVINISFNLWLF